MARFTATQTLTAYTPELITDVDGITVDAIITKIGDKAAKAYVVVGFDLAWTSKAFMLQVVVRKVGATRRQKISGKDLASWVIA